MERTRAGIVAACLLATPVLVPSRPAHAGPACNHSIVPFQGLAGAALVPEDHVSKDDPPVSYTRWRGLAPGFDGMPFSVDVTVPCGLPLPRPLVVMNHGFTDDKTVWEETGKSDRVVSEGRPESNSYWNNIWFASKGYAVLNLTARGWHDSCGPNSAGAVTGVAPGPQCLPYQYWIHLDDKRWEVRDIQWLTGALVQSGVADPGRLAVTGGSYGGAPSAMAALLGPRTMCGASAMPSALGPDPCTGRADGELVPWTTPDGNRVLHWAAALPLYTFADLIQVLAPNGRGSDGDPRAPPDGSHTDPFGVPIQSTVAGLLAAGQASGFFAPPGVDPTSDIFLDAGRLLVGNPFAQADPLVARGIHVYRQFKSPITTDPAERVPIFWVQGFTDPLFPGLEALQMVQRLRAVDPGYPIKLFLGDLGHDYTGQRQDEWDLVRAQMNAFLDHYLSGSGAVPSFDVGATVTRCLDHDAPLRYAAAKDWSALHPRQAVFVSNDGGVTSSAAPGPAALATDPITTATLALPGAYKGCRKMSPSQPDQTAVTAVFHPDGDTTLMGSPVVDITYDTTGPDTELNVRLWDVAADGSVQGLVTRGTYRSLDGPGTGLHARFQIAPQGYRFAAGHGIKVEVSANDAPYHQASNVPAVVRAARVELVLPLLADAPPGPGAAAALARVARLASTGGTGVPVVGLAAVAGFLIVRRRIYRRAR
ncbi:MAG: type transport system ATP-binding protein [Actinomycetota bacterium]|jgi:hypothetical protein